LNKKTIEKAIELEGVGIHSGRNIHLTLKPSESGRIEFVRRDRGEKRIELDPNKIEANFCTILTDGETKVQTIEHLMAVLHVFGLDSLMIELWGEEIPIMDGSAFPFAKAVQEAGIVDLQQEKKRIRITKSFLIQEGGASVEAAPDPNFRISYRIDYDHPAIGEQEISLAISQDSFIEGIAPARTFGFLDDVPFLVARGLARGGSLENAIVLDEKGVINGPLRFPDEFVRHKVLDLLGDLALFGASLVGHFKGNKAGHHLHRACVLFLLDNPDHWAEI
jgi:UDP-3-O-[3-hydroxymyristoyl] N-acetylglucosamine deacetylase